jgi:3-dehydroquinate dehydratase / shikimate dehydrogenase
MAKICLCLTASTIAEDLEILERYRGKADIAELRVDFLLPSEQQSIRKFPALAGLPVILTIRRKADGGRWSEGEGARLVLYSRGIAFADSDSRKNFAYVDLESDFHAPAVEEAARTFRIRIIRSLHDMSGMPPNCEAVLRTLPRYSDEIAKLAAKPQSMKDCLDLFRATVGRGKASRIVIGMGPYGLWTRVLADRLGSELSYTSPLDSGGNIAAPGQVDPAALERDFRFRSLDGDSGFLAEIGPALPSAELSARLNEAFGRRGRNLAMIPMAVDSQADFLEFADIAGLSGFSIAAPYRLQAPVFCSMIDGESRRSGMVTAMRRSETGWEGFDVETPCLASAIREISGGRGLRFSECVVVGKGALARSAVLAASALGASVMATDRELSFRGGNGMRRLRCRWAGREGDALGKPSKRRLFVLAGEDPSGRESERDPLPYYRFSGSERVLDLAGSPRDEALLNLARESGCSIHGAAAYQAARSESLFTVFAGPEEKTR